jgi:hypothetical protein
MSDSATRTGTATFDLTNAKELAAKLVADLQGCHYAYGGVPSFREINDLATEITYLLRDGYISKLEVGFYEPSYRRRLTWMYTVSGSTLGNAGLPGGIQANCNIEGTFFGSLVWRTETWKALSEQQQINYYEPLASKRSGSVTPTDGSGSWSTKSVDYSSGSKMLTRTSFTPYLK